MLIKMGIPVIGLSLPPEKNSLYLKLKPLNYEQEIYQDIRDANAVNLIIKKYSPSAIFHLAAQPLVMESYRTPRETFETNVMGTANLLHSFFDEGRGSVFIGVTTDKVYKNENGGRRFEENDPLEGKDPYSASKVATESVIKAWQNISKLEGGPTVLSVRAGNVIGGGDLAEKRIMPDIVRNLYLGEKIEIRNKLSTRPWQHVLDPLSGYVIAANHALNTKKSECFNFGPSDSSLTVEDLLNEVKKIRQEEFSDILYSSDHGNYESELLDLNSEKAKNELNWIPKWSQVDAIASTIEWWKNFQERGISALDACELDFEQLNRKSASK
jgi:CDP-glucose 4,6-dehydratase